MPVISILIGGIAAYALGVVWYMVLSGPWMKAVKLTREDISGGSGGGMSASMALTYSLTLVIWMVASFVLHVHLLPMVIAAGSNPFQAVIGMWLAFALLSTVLSTLYGMRGKNLIWIDAGYVLGGALLITAAFTFVGS
jgi:hypothetical protein